MSAWLIAATLLVLLTRLTGYTAQRVGQPFIVGELIGGLLVGPSVLGRVAPDWYRAVFVQSAETIHRLGELGVIVFMIVVGRHLRRTESFIRAHESFTLSLGGVLLPAVVGMVAGWAIPTTWIPSSSSRPAVVVVSAVVFGVTALPVLALMLDQEGLLSTRLGSTALVVAAVGDVACWAALMVAVHLRSGHADLRAMGILASLTCVTIVVTVVLRRRAVRLPLPSGAHGITTVLVCGALGASTLLSAFQIHPALATLGYAAALPSLGAQEETVVARLASMNSLVLVPFFVAEIGLHTRFDVLADVRVTMVVVLGCVIASLSKIVGTALGGRLVGYEWRQGAALGSFLSAKGLTEIVVLSVARDAGMIGEHLFSIGVVLALVVTLLAVPLARCMVGGLRHPSSLDGAFGRPPATGLTWHSRDPAAVQRRASESPFAGEVGQGSRRRSWSR